MLLKIFLFILLKQCVAIDLTDEEHDRLPQLFSLDNYDRCLRHNGTYCMLRLDLFADEGNELMHLIRNYSQNHHVKHLNYTYLERGVCVSTTCREFIGDSDLNDPTHLHQVLQSCGNHSVWREYGLYANVAVVNCDKKSETSNIDAYDWAVLLVLIAILVLNIIATCYDLLVEDDERTRFGKGKKMLMCFSMIGNFRYLVSKPADDPKLNSLKGINALRNSGSIPVIIGHATLVLLGGFIDNPHDVEKAFKSVYYEITFNGTYVVQIFFVIASFLLVYNLEISSETHRITWGTIPKILLFRFWRLTPPLAILMAFSATWLRHLGSGPLWGRNVVSVVQQCRKYWWTHLLYINNYVPDNAFCAKHTWHLAADTQLFVLALVVYVTTKDRGRNLVLAVLLVLGIILPALHVWLYNLDLMFFFSPEMSRNLGDDNFKYSFALGHTNIAGYVIGMYTGYKMYEWNKKGITFKNRKLVTIIRVLAVGFMFLLPRIITLINTDDVSLGTRMGFQAVYRIAVSSAIALLIMSLTVQSDDTIFNWNLWVFLGRISYSVFLVHLNILHVIVGVRTQLDHLHYLNFLMVEFGFYVLSLGVAIPFYVLIEAPMTPLIKIMMSPSEKKKLEDQAECNDCDENDINNTLEQNNKNVNTVFTNDTKCFEKNGLKEE